MSLTPRCADPLCPGGNVCLLYHAPGIDSDAEELNKAFAALAEHLSQRYRVPASVSLGHGREVWFKKSGAEWTFVVVCGAVDIPLPSAALSARVHFAGLLPELLENLQRASEKAASSTRQATGQVRGFLAGLKKGEG
jgi:hypothetical protein